MPLITLKIAIRRVDVRAYLEGAVMTGPMCEIRERIKVTTEMVEDKIIEEFKRVLREEVQLYNEAIRKANGPYAGEALRIVNEFLSHVFRESA